MALTTTFDPPSTSTTSTAHLFPRRFPSPSYSSHNHHHHHQHALLLPLRPSPSQFTLHIPKSSTLCLSPSLPLTTTNTQKVENPIVPGLRQPTQRPPFQSLELCEDEDDHADQCLHLLHLSVRHGDLGLGRALHATTVKTRGGGGGEDTVLVNNLISMYGKLSCLSDARKVFECMLCPDVVSYSSLISAYAKCGREEEAVGLFFQMRRSGVEPNEFSFVAVLTSCIRSLNPQLGSELHALAIKTNHCSDVYVSNALIALYVKRRRVEDAARLFRGMPNKDVSSWNAIILGMVKDLRYGEAFKLFHGMRMDGFHGDQFTVSSLLTAAEEGFFQEEGEGLHAHCIKMGLELDLSVNNALIAFYTEFGCTEDVVSIFQRMPIKDVISWTGMVSGLMEFGQVESAVEVFDKMTERNCVSYNALLSGFCQNGDGSRALDLFQEMVEDGIEFSDFTLTSVINACALVREVKKSEQVHGFVLKVGCKFNAWIEAALLDMYVKCNRMEDAEKMLSRWVNKESISIAHTSLICGYASNGRPIEALSFFNAIVVERDVLSLDEVALASVLGVCGTLGFEEMGKQIHCYSVKSGNLSNTAVGNSIVSMYAKCGNMDDAIEFFNLMPSHDTVSWNALITAHLLHRQGDEALSVWKKMERMAIKPDSISFLLILLACKYTNSTSVDICRCLFASMTISYGIRPSEEHYASLVEVLVHWNCFDEAEEWIKAMPVKPTVLVWRALLDSCRSRSSLSLGRQAVQHILELRPQDASTYVLISNLYSASGRWHCSEKVRKKMREKGMQKHPAQSWIIHQNRIHSFCGRDRSHAQSKDIYSALEILILECMKAGYVPDTSFVLHEVEEYQKKDFLFYHSAKLAITYGLLTTTLGRPIRVMKNIHLCGDCHSFLKYVSIVTGREINLRDTTGFHCFKGGECLCRYHW